MSQSLPPTETENAQEITSGSQTRGLVGGVVQQTSLEAASPLGTTTLEDRSKAQVFLSFNYPELKDLGKHFLTLSSATAVFLLTFVEKLIGSNTSFSHVIKACMALLLFSIAAAGTGLFFNYIAGAGASGAVI